MRRQAGLHVLTELRRDAAGADPHEGESPSPELALSCSVHQVVDAVTHKHDGLIHQVILKHIAYRLQTTAAWSSQREHNSATKMNSSPEHAFMSGDVFRCGSAVG